MGRPTDRSIAHRDDPTAPGLDAARQRAQCVRLDDRAQFRQGTFEHTGLPDACSRRHHDHRGIPIAARKRAALTEFARILKPGGRVAIVCFEVDPAKVNGVPVLGVDPIVDYTPLLIDAGFAIDAYEETPGWAERVYGTFTAVIDAAPQLNDEMGERAAAGALAEATLTVATKPYPRRILAVATRSA